MWTQHLAGNSIRTLAGNDNTAVGTASNRVRDELAALPQNELITKTYCTRFGGVLCVDGVYIKVKGLLRAVPFIYGIDFETHDIPAGILALAENEAAFERLFLLLKDIGYPLRLVVADETFALKVPLHKLFPGVEVQLCHVHILRNIRVALGLSSRNETHLLLFREIQKLLALRGEEARRSLFGDMVRRKNLGDEEWKILRSIRSRWDDLFRYEAARREGVACPRTNNLIEGYNNHLKTRVNGIKGFESLSSASRWLNGWLLRRRFTPFHECGKPFEHLNGHSSFEQSRNLDLPWPEIPGISPKKPT